MSQSAPEAAPDSRPPAPPTLLEYASSVTTERLTHMLSQADGVRHDTDIEPVHQMRVWSRRSRAALEVFASLFESDEYREMEREVKAVTGALGEARDLDVMIETLEKRAEALPPAQRPGVEVFIERLRQRRRACQKDVEKAVKRLEKGHIVHTFERVVEARAADEARRVRRMRRQTDG